MDFLQKIDGIHFVNGEISAPSDKQFMVYGDKSSSYIDLKDFFVFFKLKNENYDQFSSSLIEKLEKKRFIELKFHAATHSFSKLDGFDNLSLFDLIPFHLFERFAHANYEFYQECVKEFELKPIYDEFLEFYTENVELFHITERLRGEFHFGNTEFEFAENFRFKSCKNTFDLFHLKKEERDIVSCPEDFFIYSPDYKQFEFRTFLKLINYDKSIFSESIYDFLGDRMGMPPEKAKLAAISWLYSPYPNDRLDSEMDKSIILDKICEGCGNFGFPVYIGENVAPHKQVHTVVQSVSQFIYIEKLHRVLNLLQHRKSKFVFPLHDSMIFFIHKSEIELMESIDEIMEDEIYKTKKYVGKNYKDVQEI